MYIHNAKRRTSNVLAIEIFFIAEIFDLVDIKRIFDIKIN